MISVIIPGANGRMGKTLIQRASLSDTYQVVGALEKKGCEAINQDAGVNAGIKSLHLKITDSLDKLENDGTIIDFTLPEACMNHLKYALSKKWPMVIGTTGFSESQKKEIKNASQKIPIVMAPNMSVGVNVLFSLIKQAAIILGNTYDIEILEAHHKHKKDAPSGTAVGMAHVLADATHRKYPDDFNFSRHGLTERNSKEIGMQVIRAGDIVGEHTAFFCGEGERVEIKHVATSRATFADGALRAALWLENKKSGLFDMHDVLQIPK